MKLLMEGRTRRCAPLRRYRGYRMLTDMAPRFQTPFPRMGRIDSLGWTAGIGACSYGVRIAVRTDNSDLLRAVAERLPPDCEPLDSPLVDFIYSFRAARAKASRNCHRLYFNSRGIFRALDLDSALDYLESHLKWHVAVNAETRAIVHAGVVAWQGKAIVLPGSCFAGKSTLVAALLKLGATYYSDEYAVLDSSGLVHPYARRLSLRRQGHLPSLRCTPADFGAASGVGPLPVGLVAFARYRQGERWRPRRLTPGQGAWELLNSTLTAQRRPEASLNALERVVAGAPCHKGFRGEAAETAAWLLQEVQRAEARDLSPPVHGGCLPPEPKLNLMTPRIP
jgi:hypothetical protein